jgi:hypothetical protein
MGLPNFIFGLILLRNARNASFGAGEEHFLASSAAKGNLAERRTAT